MSNLHFEVTQGEPNKTDMTALVDGMLAYHASKGHPRKTETYSIFLKENTKPVGAIIVSFLWNGMSINSLWIAEELRGKGWGTKLMNLAENEGVRRGCTVAYTDTFTWQAPEFYKKLGYEEYGRLEDFPRDNTLFYFKKPLGKLNIDKTTRR